MRIRFKKGNNHDTLTCLRDDGTSTWAAARPGRIEHDLVHYALETTLGYDRAFYGAIAQGRDLEAFGTVDPQLGRKRRPTKQAQYAEHLVLLLEANLRGTIFGDVRDALVEAHARGAVPPDVTYEHFERARQRAVELLRCWAELPARETLELCFPALPDGGKDSV